MSSNNKLPQRRKLILSSNNNHNENNDNQDNINENKNQLNQLKNEELNQEYVKINNPDVESFSNTNKSIKINRLESLTPQGIRKVDNTFKDDSTKNSDLIKKVALSKLNSDTNLTSYNKFNKLLKDKVIYDTTYVKRNKVISYELKPKKNSSSKENNNNQKIKLLKKPILKNKHATGELKKVKNLQINIFPELINVVEKPTFGYDIENKQKSYDDLFRVSYTEGNALNSPDDSVRKNNLFDDENSIDDNLLELIDENDEEFIEFLKFKSETLITKNSTLFTSVIKNLVMLGIVSNFLTLN